MSEVNIQIIRIPPIFFRFPPIFSLSKVFEGVFECTRVRTLTSHSVENDTMSSSTNPPVNAAHYSCLSSAGEDAVPIERGNENTVVLLANVLFPHPTHTTPTKKQRDTNKNKIKWN